MANQTLVGRSIGRFFALKTVVDWALTAWRDELGYVPEVTELAKNWFSFNFQKPEHALWALGRNWNISNVPLLLKPWTPLFDASRERLYKIPVWVRLPALRLHYWTLDHFKAIGNILGDFLEADMSFQETHIKKVARILVCLNITEGLPEKINLKWGPFEYTQMLDYENVPFRCRRCHHIGHLLADCHLPPRTKRKRTEALEVNLSREEENDVSASVQPASDRALLVAQETVQVDTEPREKIGISAVDASLREVEPFHAQPLTPTASVASAGLFSGSGTGCLTGFPKKPCS